jgi:nucleoside-diphosphate kinase
MKIKALLHAFTFLIAFLLAVPGQAAAAEGHDAGSFSAALKGLHISRAAPTPAVMALETTMILLKPDAIEKHLTGKVLDRFEVAGFVIRAIKMMQLDEAILREHYAHITHIPVFPALLAFMQRTPVIAMVLEGENCIAKVRELIGPTNSQAAAPGTIRGDFGENMMVNICHASDSAEAATTEIQRFFKDDEVFTF